MSALGNQPDLFTAKAAKDAKKEEDFLFSLSFAVFASFAVELLGRS